MIKADVGEAAQAFNLCDLQVGPASAVALNCRRLLRKLQYRKLSSGWGSVVVAVNVRIWENCISHVRLFESKNSLEFAAWFSVSRQHIIRGILW
jgi:hypothetical protein